ncbi:hypothetical protein TPHA_0H02360 [Tetrapisispora phaffii CBS 4417]|uniref:Thioredoxin domain-containing protein n=1 Tax=Tetrapisispora phaffii (strain ATCC 24235 / CBS 4417 / NBRC 1672 / NRRL Y-8282 / UCD 70-5) TaxID=1071381 RepID=G8BWI9_TETPH|nr:hypothetical protein TPHA_0H02360 [Tetrapisispora phaffii CBS 4417]CCE64440.1 hypothetical protein TPHA_0H02360 [Tetrapisispora phaffii CBS 4417]
MFRRTASTHLMRPANRMFVRMGSTYKDIHKITSLAEYEKLISRDEGKLSVIDFYATWCGPCKAMAPHLSKFVKEYSKVNFYKIDVDENVDIAQKCAVTAMPTFFLVKDGEVLDKVVGADPHKLEEQIKELN